MRWVEAYASSCRKTDKDIDQSPFMPRSHRPLGAHPRLIDGVKRWIGHHPNSRAPRNIVSYNPDGQSSDTDTDDGKGGESTENLTATAAVLAITAGRRFQISTGVLASKLLTPSVPKSEEREYQRCVN